MANSFWAIALAITAAVVPIASIAQCPGCSPDPSCTSSPAFPTICPAQPPVGTAGIPYTADLSFWLPASFSDPENGITVEFQQMTVTGISGLPLGLSLETSDPTGVYFPQQNEYGCARICGTPIVAGLYNITIGILATVELGGFVTQVPEEFSLLLQILPGEGGNASFTFSPESGCGSVLVNFEALIDGDPLPTSYTWDLGNGNTSTAPNPAHLFDGPGEYPVTLTTTIGGYVITEVSISGVNGNWCGDVEEPNVPFVGCTGSPDLYFVLTDGNGGTYGSSTHDNTFSASWTGLSLVLSQPPYSITFYDEDNVSQNDQLGTFNIPADGVGTYFINVAGGTTGQLQIQLEPQEVFVDTDTIVVHPLPLIEIQEISGELCAADTTLIGATWLLNGDTIEGVNSLCIDPILPGSYQLIASNALGCENISGGFVICPELEIVQTENVLHVPSGYNSYSWYLNGEPIEGADQPFLIIEGTGNYSVEVDAGDGCVITASISFTTAISEFSEKNGLVVFPNPAKGPFRIIGDGMIGSKAKVELINAVGSVVFSTSIPINNGKMNHQLQVDQAIGNYHLRITDQHRTFTRKLTIQ